MLMGVNPFFTGAGELAEIRERKYITTEDDIDVMRVWTKKGIARLVGVAEGYEWYLLDTRKGDYLLVEEGVL